ncbi:hypothetical protein CBR_g8687 [Chara braunii]|uniref:Uncharacterized protein n=1 Tax=Chara braunii TaxID=69332 RepID=A0A388KMH8_CHABU|nr:hypothetical protein CBR_g8687 [Chara braunii]|eukprot:GBG71266.1 hypothetical protein CBR_g8687 [Chara braunii]
MPPAGKPGAPTSAQNKRYGRSKTYNDKPWALDWVGGLHKPGCGAVIFLNDDNGATWYCCGGVEKSEAGRKTYEGRTFRTFFLTSVFDSAGTDWVKEDKKVSLDLRLFQGYGVKAFSMKAFHVRGDGTEFRMLSPEEFLSKPNANRVTGCLPVVDSSFQMSKPLVQFNSPMDLLPGVVKRYRKDFSKLPPDQQADCVFLPFEAGSKSRRQTLSATTGKIKQLPGGPSGVNLPSPSVRGGRDLAQGSSEATEFDDRLLHQCNIGRENSRGSAVALDEDNDEDEEEGSVGPHDDGGNEADVEVGDDNMQDRGALADEDADTPMHGHDISPVGAVGAARGQPSTSRGISLSQSRSKGGHDSHAMQGPKAKKRTRETSPSASTHKRQARIDAVNEARGALTASQEARPPRKNNQGGRSGGQGGGREGGGRGGARKGSQRVRPQELRDSRDEGEGVDPRMPEDADEPVQRVAPIDTTRCFFLEYDDQGFATQDIYAVRVDVMRIKRIPRGRILFNHRSLPENIVRGMENAIESSISTDPWAWDRPELLLAPVDRNNIVGGQGRGITPTEFLERDPAEFDWHTVFKVYGLNAYSKVRVIYFGDDQTRGYFNVSCFDNTRENRSMMLSFEDAVRDIRQWWRDNNRIEAPKAKVSEKDDVVVAHQKTWQNFLRACMGKACDKAFVKQALENEYSKDWSNKLRGYMNLATSSVTVWPLVERFFKMFNEGKLPVSDGKIPLDMPGRMEGRLPGPYTDETKGKRTLYHCIYATYGPKGSTVSWKDLCPSYFKNFRDLTCREREVALLLLMKGKVVATNVKVLPPRVNTECLLDIVRKERYMVCMFNYILFCAEGRVDDEWNDAFFMSYKDLEDRIGFFFFFAPQKVQSNVLRHLFRWEDVEVIPGTWKRVDRPPNDITRYGNMATTSRDMMAIVLHAEGGDLKKVTVKPRLHNDLTTVHVVEEKFEKCQGKHGGIEGDDSAVYSICEREPGKLRSLCGSFVGDVEGVLLLGRAHAGLVWELLQAGNNVIACDESAKDIAFLTKFVDILVKDERFACHVEKPRCKHRSNRDMFHKLGRKRLKVWEYLFRDAPQGRLNRNYIYRKAKVIETLKNYHGALTGAFETFVARCEILKFDLYKDHLTSKYYADLANSGDGFNLIDSEEDSSESDLELGEDKGGEGPGGGMVRSHDEGTVRSYERPVPVDAHSVGSMVAPMEGTDLPNMGICGPDDEDDIDMPGEASKLAPGDSIPPGYCADPTTIYFLGGKHARTGEDKWGHDILEYSWKFYALRTSLTCGSIDWKVNQTIGTMEESSSQDVVPLSASPPVPTQAGQREDDGTTVVKTQEVHMTSMPQISVAVTEPSKRMDVSNALSSDAGATYGSLLLTCAALEGTSKMQSESGVGLSVPDSQLQPELCTGKGDAQSPLTPQGGVVADGRKGGDMEGILHPRNLETLTDDFDYGGEGGNDVVNTRGV